ncbi:methyl-accepting chemotaxis protein [Dongia sp. agr-C8]
MNAFQNMKLSGKLGVCFAAILVVIIAVGVVSSLQNRIIRSASEQARQTAEDGVLLQNVTERVTALQWAIGEMLITGSATYKQAYLAGIAGYEDALAKAKEAVAGDATLSQALSDAETAIADWRKNTADRQVALMEHPSTVNEARAIELTGVGARLNEALQKFSGQVHAYQNSLSDQRFAEQQSAISLTLTATLIGAAISLVIAVLSGVALSRGVAKPIISLNGSMQSLAQGNLLTEVPVNGRTDEVGQMAKTVLVFKESMVRNEEMRRAQEAEQRDREQRAEHMMNLTRAFDEQVKGMVEGLASAARGMERTAVDLTKTADVSAAESQTVAAAAQEAQAGVETVASASEELSASISEISRQVTNQANLAQTSVNAIELTTRNVTELSEASQKIGEVVRLINEIAEQTNLLALNATIEAARAGEAGKGFAVVASEVKNLANQTAKATEEIGAQVGGIQATTKGTVDSIAAVGGQVRQMNDISSAVAAAVEEQNAATQEISRNVQQASEGTKGVTHSIEVVSAEVAKTRAAAQSVMEAAKQMLGESEGLKTYIDSFLNEVRAV